MSCEIHSVTCSRAGLPILGDVSFSVAEGQACLLDGPNGVGKTTLLQVLAGIIPATSGTISFGSDDIIYVGHLDGMKASLSVRQNLEFWAKIGGGTIAEAVERMRLGDLLDRDVQTLSSGQKKRVSLARLFLADRPLWLLDEPTVSLDAETVRFFETVLGDHLKKNGSIIFASHAAISLESLQQIDLLKFRKTAELAPVDAAFLEPK